MRHQKKKKYSDQQEIDRKDYSQKEYRRTQKYKTGWRARWGEFKDHLVKIFRICFLIMVPIVTVYLRCFYDGISENSIYGLWQSENHKLAISYNEGGKSRKYDWEIIQDGKLLIKNARTQKIKGLKDGTIYIEVYAKRIDDRDKTITWKDGSTSVYGERKTFFDYIEPFLFWGMMGALFLSCIVICWRNIKSKK